MPITTKSHLLVLSGQAIRLLRTLKGIKQTFLAKKLGISQQAYSKLESCEHLSEGKLRSILNAMNCTYEDLELISRYLLQTITKHAFTF